MQKPLFEVERKPYVPRPPRNTYVYELNSIHRYPDIVRELRFRRTPEGEPLVPDLVNIGDTITTSYGSEPYSLREVAGPFRFKVKGEVYEHYSLVMGGDAIINELVAVGGRLLKLFENNDDEVFFKPYEVKPGYLL